VGVANPWEWLKYMGVAQIHRRGSTYKVAMPSLFKMYVGWSFIEMIKQTSLEFRQKVQFQDVGVAQLILLPRPLAEKSCTQWGRFSCILTYSFIHKEFVECLCVNSCDLSKK